MGLFRSNKNSTKTKVDETTADVSTTSDIKESVRTTTSTSTTKIVVPTEDTPDIYGQIHAIESTQLIEESLFEFEQILKEQPTTVSADAYLAEIKCPTLCTKQFKLVFIRTEVFRIHDAVTRYMKYWTKRIELFGTDRAFQPIIIQNLIQSEIDLLQTQYVSIIPATTLLPLDHISNTDTSQYSGTTKETRSIFYVNNGLWDKSTMCTIEWIRLMWYFIHCLIDDIDTQKKGMVFISNPQGFKIKQLPNTSFLSYAMSFVQDIVPLRLSCYHVIYPPKIIKIIFPILSMVLKEKLRKRLLVHTDNDFNKTLLRLTTMYGISKSRLPQHMGGDYIVNHDTYIQQQIQNGK